jgi:hypothetical protein
MVLRFGGSAKLAFGLEDIYLNFKKSTTPPPLEIRKIVLSLANLDTKTSKPKALACCCTGAEKVLLDRSLRAATDSKRIRRFGFGFGVGSFPGMGLSGLRWSKRPRN